MTGQRILVVDDEAKMRRLLEIMLSEMGYEVLQAADGREALQCLGDEGVDLVITDLRMPEMDGVALLNALREDNNPVPVIVVTAYGTIESAVAAMKAGASDYLIRPFDIETLELAINRTLDMGRIRRENTFLRQEADKGWGEFIGQSAAMRKVFELIRQVAPSNASVLITGETGTGKELVAHAIHHSSQRSGLFVPINCAAIPAEILESELFGHSKGAFTGALKDRTGKFELAHGGTLFLDEITEMAPALQAKLLRVLQEGELERLGSNRTIPIDIRVIAATNCDPRAAVQEGRLREDLFYRLNVFAVEIPPLRDRRDDIPLLACHFLKKHCGHVVCNLPALGPAVLEKLQDYDWPGNVRELENVMERAGVLSRGGTVEISHLPRELVNPAPATDVAAPESFIENQNLDLEANVEKIERRLIEQALQQSNGNKAKASRLLKISERSLWYKLKKYDPSGC
jgi:two-component system response regulator AtoC